MEFLFIDWPEKASTLNEKPARFLLAIYNSIYLMEIQFSLTVNCSKETYIRNLVEDIGDALSVGAHVTQLHRFIHLV